MTSDAMTSCGLPFGNPQPALFYRRSRHLAEPAGSHRKGPSLGTHFYCFPLSNAQKSPYFGATKFFSLTLKLPCKENHGKKADSHLKGQQPPRHTHCRSLRYGYIRILQRWKVPTLESSARITSVS